MTNELIEIMVRAVAKEIDSNVSSAKSIAFVTLKAMQETHRIIPKDELIVLEEGAKPEVGDVVIYKRGMFPYEVAPSRFSAGITIRNTDGEKGVGALDLKIIQRNGKPVIYRGKA